MKMKAAANPDAFVEDLSGWQRDLVVTLRAAVHAGAAFDEVIKWGNLVFVHEGLCILIHAEEHRIVFGFFRRLAAQGIPAVVIAGNHDSPGRMDACGQLA